MNRLRLWINWTLRTLTIFAAWHVHVVGWEERERERASRGEQKMRTTSTGNIEQKEFGGIRRPNWFPVYSNELANNRVMNFRKSISCFKRIKEGPLRWIRTTGNQSPMRGISANYSSVWWALARQIYHCTSWPPVHRYRWTFRPATIKRKGERKHRWPSQNPSLGGTITTRYRAFQCYCEQNCLYT